MKDGEQLMRARGVCVAVFAFALVLTSAGTAASRDLHDRAAPSGSMNDVAPGEVLVKTRGGLVSATMKSVGRGSERLALPGWRRVQLRSGEQLGAALQRLRSDPAVEAATPNHIYRAQMVPDDSYFGLQWGLRNLGFGSGVDTRAPSAWDLATGSSSVIVAIVDTGVSLDHPDLVERIWVNADEVAGNGIDDDGNGYCDDVNGWDFVASTQSCGAGADNDPSDENGHGTHVAGIVGARGNDGYGVTGVMHDVRLMPLRVLDADGNGTTLSIAEAFLYARNNGAKVVNASFGGTGLDPYLRDIVADSPGVLVVAAAGNEGNDNDVTPTYPCNFSSGNVVCVAASDWHDNLASFSNYGKRSVDLAAPGYAIYSTLPTVVPASSGTHSLTDSPDGPYANGADARAQLADPLDLTGKSGCAVSYKYRLDTQDGDVVAVEYSLDGGMAWSAAGSLASGSTDGSIETASTGAIAALAGQPNVLVRVRFTSNASATDDGVYVDDFRVSCSSGGTVFSDDFETDIAGRWITEGTATWARTSVAGEWVASSGTSMAAPMVAGAAGLVWARRPASSVSHVKRVLMGSVEYRTAFKATTVSRGRLDLRRAVVYARDVAAPTAWTTGTALSQRFQKKKSFLPAWSSSDTGGSGDRRFYDVQYRRARFDRGFSSLSTWRRNTTAKSASFAGKPGFTYCYRARARDGVSNESAYSGQKCTAVPVNDRALSASSGWTPGSASGHYLGTYSRHTARGATLRMTDVRYKRLALIATKCPTCGSVQIYRGSKLIKTIDLSASKTLRTRVIPIHKRSSRSGKVAITIRVASSGKPVMIEGLGVSAT